MSHGLLVIDKPIGMTSRAALDQAARWFPRRTRIGHAGTLDPLATGVLVLCIGHVTRLTEHIQAMPKVYESEFEFGAVSATDDAEGPIEPVPGAVAPDFSDIERACGSWIGKVDQTPPAFSAAKVNGRRAYAVARRGDAVELKPRTVRIDRIEILEYRFPMLRLRIECGKGTYIRSLARDLGGQLACGGYVSTLRRTRTGPFAVESACGLDITAEEALSRVLPPFHAVGGMPSVSVSAEDIARFRHGRRIRSDCPAETVAVLDTGGNLIGVGRVVENEIQPECVLPVEP